MALNMEQFKKNQKEREKGTSRKNDLVFPFWNLDFGKSATVRFLPYEDERTGGFWAEKKMVPMSFVDNQNEDNTIRFQAPSLEMYDQNERCPMLAEVRAVFKDAEELANNGKTQDADTLKKVGLKHWINPTYYYQGFVITPGFLEEDLPENPIRIFPLKKQIHQAIYAPLTDDSQSFDSLPCGEFSEEEIHMLFDEATDDETANEIEQKLKGHNFIIRKTQQGEYPSYVTSEWARKESTLEEAELQAIKDHGFHDLTKNLPTRPTEEQYDVLVEMIQTSIQFARGEGDGLWNPEWETMGDMFKPWRGKNSGGSTSGGSSSVSRLKSKMNKSSDEEDSGEDSVVASAVRDKIKARRGVKNDDVSVAEETSTEEEVVEETSAPSSKSALAERIKNRVKK